MIRLRIFNNSNFWKLTKHALSSENIWGHSGCQGCKVVDFLDKTLLEVDASCIILAINYEVLVIASDARLWIFFY